MAEFTITCGNCGSTNCRIETIHWPEDDCTLTNIVCENCGAEEDDE